MEEPIFISVNTPSSKNSKQITKTGFIVHSKQCQRYYKDTKQEWIDGKDLFLSKVEGREKPYYVTFKFVRGSRRKFDYVNPLQTILDQMVKFGWIEDDNMTEIVPIFELYEYDKDEPGCYINVVNGFKTL